MPISAGRSSLHVPRVLLATLILAVGPGCSLIFTRGPDPEAKPPPECTTSVAAPVVDTVLAVGSFALLGVGIAELGTTCQPNGFDFCSIGQATGWVAVIAGAVTGILFTSSAAVGYTRNSACRSFMDTRGPSPPTPVEPPKSLLKHGSAQACEAVGDAPRACPRAPPPGLASLPIGAWQ
jgi:hypothetical protein